MTQDKPSNIHRIASLHILLVTNSDRAKGIRAPRSHDFAQQSKQLWIHANEQARVLTPKHLKMADGGAARQIRQMVDFIMLEAREKAHEIRTKVEFGARICHVGLYAAALVAWVWRAC